MTHPHRRTAAGAIGALALADAGLAAQTASAAASTTVTATIPVGRNPVGVAVDPATGTAYVTNASSDAARCPGRDMAGVHPARPEHPPGLGPGSERRTNQTGGGAVFVQLAPSASPEPGGPGVPMS